MTSALEDGVKILVQIEQYFGTTNNFRQLAIFHLSLTNLQSRIVIWQLMTPK